MVHKKNEILNIQEFFDPLERGDGRHLYRILSDGVKRFIQNLPDGAEIPSERKLAELFEVHRNTIHTALLPHIDAGRLLRRGRKLVVQHQNAGAFEFNPVQKQAISSLFLPPKRSELKLVNFETHRMQEIFWSETIQQFEVMHPGVKITLLHPDQNDYNGFLRKVQPDLFQLYCPVVQNLKLCNDLVAPLPSGFNAEVERDFFADEPNFLDFVVPMSSSIWLNLVNLDLAEKYHLRIEEFAAGNVLYNFAEDAQKLPRDIKLTSHCDALLTSVGFPRENTRELLQQYYGEGFSLFERMAERGESGVFYPLKTPFLWLPDDLIAAFLDSRVVHISIPMPLFLRDIRLRAKFKTQFSVMYRDSREMIYPCGLNGFCVNAHSSEKNAAFEFLRHIKEEQEQRRLTRMTGCVPFNRNAREELSSWYPYTEPMRKYYKIISSRVLDTFWSGKLPLNGYIKSIFERKISVKDAADNATEQFLATFY